MIKSILLLSKYHRRLKGCIVSVNLYSETAQKDETRIRAPQTPQSWQPQLVQNRVCYIRYINYVSLKTMVIDFMYRVVYNIIRDLTAPSQSILFIMTMKPQKQ